MSNIRLANSIFVNQLGKQGRSGERAASNTQVGSSNCWFTSFPVVLNLSYYYTGAVTARQDLCSFICVIETVSMRVGHGAPQSGAALVRRTSVFASGENLGAGAALPTPSIKITYGYQIKGHDFRRVLLFGDPAGTRTPDLRLKRALLYQLSY